MNAKDLTRKANVYTDLFLKNVVHIKHRESLHRLRREFVEKFPIAEISDMNMEDYVYGRYKLTSNETFCYSLENKLWELGNISGSPYQQYGVFYSAAKNIYGHTKKYGDNLNEAFKAIIFNICSLLESGLKADLRAIESNKISAKFKGKILSTYFPERYLNIFSNEYLNDILIRFGVANSDNINAAPIYKQLALIHFKNRHPILRHFSIDDFAHFINTEMYEGINIEPKLDEPIKFPINPNISFVEHDLVEYQTSPIAKSKSKPIKIDFDKRNRRNKIIGEKGELYVLIAEKKFLNDHKFDLWIFRCKLHHHSAR